jgi:hypothetical protein
MSSPQVSKPVIPISTREWQRQKFGFSLQRELRWNQRDIENLTKAYKKLIPVFQKFNSDMLKLADKLKNARVYP